MVGVESVGELASHDLRAAVVGGASHVAPSPRAALGTERVAHPLAVRVRPAAERQRTDRLAPRLRGRPAAAARLGSSVRNPPRPRPATRQTVWPGEDEAEPIEDTPIIDRDEDFVAYVIADVERRRQLEHDFYANLNPETGEIT